MTFLELCQRVRSMSGITGTTATPTTVASQVGELGRVVEWTKDAWRDIQNSQTTWLWMRGSFSLPTVAGTEAYTPAAAGLTNFLDWHRDTLRCYLTSSGVSDEQWMVEWSYPVFRDYYEFGAQQSVTARPSCFAVRPSDKALLLGSIPDDIYTVRGEYQKAPTELAADDDTPEMPVQFHMLIVYGALMKYAAYENAPEVMTFASREYSNMMLRLCQDQLDTLSFGFPLAG